MIKILINFLLCVCLVTAGYGQSYVTVKTAKPELKEKFKEGQILAQKGDIDLAIKKYLKVLKEEPRLIDAYIELGFNYESSNDFNSAIEAFKNVLKIDTFYKIPVLYRLGLLEKRQNLFRDAQFHLSRFIALYKGTDTDILNHAKSAESLMQLQIEAEFNGYKFIPENLGPNINTNAHEALPCLTADGETLVFTRKSGNNEGLFETHLINARWSPSTPITDLNINQKQGAQSISADGKTMVFTGCSYPEGYGDCDLYISYNKNGSWTKPVNMGPLINSAKWDAQPSISANGNILFFASTHLSSNRQSNIWVSKKDINGNWGKPFLLPAIINTSLGAESPFIHPDGKSLYFRSQAYTSFGGFDLFLSRLNDDNTWTTPKNLGKGINTDRDEGALVIDLNGEYAYFTSDMKQSEGVQNYGGVDIYRVKINPEIKPFPVTYVKAKVVDQATGKPITARVQLEDLTSQKSFYQSETDEQGTFLVCLPAGKSYALNVSKDKYIFFSENYTLDSVKSKKDPYLLEIKLQKLDGIQAVGKSTPITLRNIFFDSGSSVLKNTSNFELNRLYELLSTNPNIKIRINGHTDNVGTEADNLSLSENRAKAVYTYLINKGIPASRISYKGFGESKPVASNDTEAERQSNRRTEFELIH